ncbi:MAG: Ig-like domain-containing protein, partial [Anaerolineae bacterium]|nr:Ig-like domain-containing protein [Anaerolineae bacterium]
KYCEDALFKSRAADVQQDRCQAITAAGGGCGSFPGPEMRPARDPNAKYGPVGDVLPGQTMSYTITYENEGSGEAYGVYIVDDLDPSLDESTLVLHGPAQYYSSTRTIIWSVGTLAPKGQAGSTGAIRFTVNLKPGLPGGTLVVNRATVYFPSVPEETPTNPVVSMVQPAVAVPQNLTTAYRTPLAITLSGREVSSLPLTYEIVEPPRGGSLTGTPPNLTYTPAENFTGPDAFTFRVSNGTSSSRPAQVYIEVTPQGDTTPPQVLWTNPADGAAGIAASATPVFTDTVGPAYAPVIVVGVSEPLDATTVHSGTVTLARSSGAAVAASAAFNGGANQIVLTPRVALGDGEYRATVTTGIKDVAGNGLAAAYTARFTVGDPTKRIYLPLVLRR